MTGRPKPDAGSEVRPDTPPDVRSGFLATREPDLVEWMDRADCDPARLRATYRHFPRVNRWIARWPTLYRRRIRPVLAELSANPGVTEDAIRILDVGSGGGDIARAVARWARNDGFPVSVTGIDPDPRALDFALAAGPEPGAGPVTFRRAEAADLVAAGERFHIVLSNHVLHHLNADMVRPFLSELEALATHHVVVSDIERSRIGYVLFSIFGHLPPFRDSYIRHDGLISIRRSFTERELAAVVPPGWRVVRFRPYRLLAIRELDADPRRVRDP